MKHFTDTVWLVTFERSSGYNRYYGIASIHNKPADAQLALDKLNQESINDSRIEYQIQKIGLNEKKELFAFYY